LPEHEPAEILQMLAAFDNGQEVVACELAQLARETCCTIGKQDLGFAQSAGVEQDISRRRIAGRILDPYIQIEIPQRNPACLPAPARVDKLLSVGQQPAELHARPRRTLIFHVCDERE
jgi:hypothetical protein